MNFFGGGHGAGIHSDPSDGGLCGLLCNAAFSDVKVRRLTEAPFPRGQFRIHDGYLVTTLPLGPVLGAGGTGGSYSIPNVPGGSSTQSFAPGLYYLHGLSGTARTRS